MKGILVIDLPTDCIKCPLANGYCWNTFPTKGRADGCPIKPLPEKSGLIHQDADGWCKLSEYSRGWNDCLEEIEKC